VVLFIDLKTKTIEQMTAEEEAKELVDKFYHEQIECLKYATVMLAKQCALICVDEKINEIKILIEMFGKELAPFTARLIYLSKVKQEILKQ